MRSRAPVLIVMAGMLGLGGALSSATAQVELRGGERLDAPVEESTLAGLRLKPEEAGGRVRVVSWDRVKQVEGAAGGERFGAIGEKLWRARTRVERGDYAAAEPLLDELAQAYGAERGPSAAVVAECLLRCRLARGAQGAATSAWLWWTWLTDRSGETSGDVWVGGGTDLPPVVDAATGLSASLPPVWAPVASTAAAAASTEWSRTRARGGVVGELAELYEKAARFEAGMDDEIAMDGAGSGEGAGVSLVREMVLARGGDAEAREDARARLAERLRQMGPGAEGAKNKGPASPRWVEAWCRLGVGRSLVRETESAMRMRGVIELLHVPARFAEDQPFLAGVALAEAAVTMSELGDVEGASALKGELLARFQGHSVLGWEAIKNVPMTNDGGKGRAAPAMNEKGGP